MANISSAFGDMSISAPSINDLAVFAYYFHKSNNSVEYYTNLNQIDEFKNFDDVLNFIKNNHNILDDKNSKRFEFNSSFCASGRWTFENNLDWFFNLKEYKDEIEELSDNGYAALIESIEINVNYIEYECGCAFIDEATAVVKAKKSNNNEFESDVTINHKPHDYTVENLRNICGYDEVYSVNDALKNMNEYFTKDALKNHKTEIENSLTAIPDEKRNLIYFDIDEMFEDLDIQIPIDYLN